MNAPFDFKATYFRRPVFTEDNIRFGSILLVLSLLILITQVTLVDWFKNMPAAKLRENIRSNYIALIAENIPPAAVPQETEEIDFIQTVPETTTGRQGPGTESTVEAKTELRGTDISDLVDETSSMGIATIASAVESATGYSSDRYMKDRQERPLRLLPEVTVFRSHQEHIHIPVPERIQFASQNGNRDLFETTATMEANEIDIKYCFEKFARYDPSLSGDLLVKFTIHPDGHVIPGSVRVINSNIRDPRIINCIRKQIQRWRNFKPIALLDGNFTVTRKYVF